MPFLDNIYLWLLLNITANMLNQKNIYFYIFLSYPIINLITICKAFLFSHDSFIVIITNLLFYIFIIINDAILINIFVVNNIKNVSNYW